MSGEAFLNRLSAATYAPLIGWPGELPLPVEVSGHLFTLKKEAPAVLFWANVAGCVLLQLLSRLRFGRALNRVDDEARDAFLRRLAESRIFQLRLLLMLLKGHALFAAYRNPAPRLSPPLFERRPPWTAHLPR